MQHEFIHAFGVYHAQSRTDRDEFVEIKWDNIQKGYEHNFFKKDGKKVNGYTQADTENFNVPYDPYSIMHYYYNSWAKDYSKPTIASKVNSFLHCSSIFCFLLRIFQCLTF